MVCMKAQDILYTNYMDLTYSYISQVESVISNNAQRLIGKISINAGCFFPMLNVPKHDSRVFEQEDREV